MVQTVEPIDMGIVRYSARQVAQGLLSAQTGSDSPIWNDDSERSRVARHAHRVLAAPIPTDSREAQVARAFLELDRTRSSDLFVIGLHAAHELMPSRDGGAA